MRRDKASLKSQLQQFTKTELMEMVLKLSAKRFNYEYLLVNVLEPQSGEEMLFDEALEDLELIYLKEFKGRTIQHQRVKMLGACVKRINEFTVETKNKKLEADLILSILERQFEQSTRIFGAKFSGYDYKVGLLVKRLITLVTKKLHPDYLVDYEEKINDMLDRLHKTSNRINTIQNLPNTIA